MGGMGRLKIGVLWRQRLPKLDIKKQERQEKQKEKNTKNTINIYIFVFLFFFTFSCWNYNYKYTSYCNSKCFSFFFCVLEHIHHTTVGRWVSSTTSRSDPCDSLLGSAVVAGCAHATILMKLALIDSVDQTPKKLPSRFAAVGRG